MSAGCTDSCVKRGRVHRQADRLVAAVSWRLHRLQQTVQHCRHQGLPTAGLSSRTPAWACMMLAVPALPGNGLQDLFTNIVFMTGFWAWFLAQFGKVFTKRFKQGVWDIRAVVQPGGMPSSHSSLCSGVTTAVALQYGLGSPLFAACIAFSVIVMYDAMGIRRHAGKQAEVLNQVINELMEDHPIVGEIKLKEVLGHTPRQVVCGALVGVLTGLFYPALAVPA